jgi:hypothetical protein
MLPGLLLTVACGPNKETAARAAATVVRPAVAAPRPKPGPMVRFVWETDACRHTGWYKKGLYREKQLRNTQALEQATYLETDVSIRQPAQYTEAHIYQLDQLLTQEYHAASRKLRAADVLPTPYWQEVKRHRLLELAEQYQLKKLVVAAYFTPDVLLRTPYPEPCRAFAAALASPDTAVVLQAWRRLVEAQKQNNGAPESLEETYQRQYDSPDRLAYAKIELLTYGWWNCANGQQKEAAFFENNSQHQEFNKLFSKVDSDCDDVD